jgi:hypothetical protein
VILSSLSDYIPFGDLAKIVVVCLFVAVVAPSAVSISIVGLDRRAQATAGRSGTAAGTALIALGVAIIAALIALGLYALFTD